jgi:acetyl-CoA carboxylase biotin carboxyl carrier protein
MIDLRYVKKLIEMLDASTVDSIEISSDKGMKLRISKSPQQRGAAVQFAPPAAVAAPVLPPPPATRPVSEGDPPEPPRVEAPRSPLLEIKSPMVGTFYQSPEPSARAYVSVGDRIAKGQVVCIIEAMKIMNELESEVDGVVREVNVKDAHPVEYGHVLFRVDPNG